MWASFRANESALWTVGPFPGAIFPFFRVAPVRFGSVTVLARDGSSGSGCRFRRFLSGRGFVQVSILF